MATTFFSISAAVIVLLLIIVACFRPLKLDNILIGITSVAYSVIYDVALGDNLGLFYYISPEKSTLYMLLSAIFVYSPLNVIYTVFAPARIKPLLAYTAAWTAAMLLFEYASLLTRTVVFTGWKPLPWSIITYIATYTWVNVFYRYLHKKVGID